MPYPAIVALFTVSPHLYVCLLSSHPSPHNCCGALQSVGDVDLRYGGIGGLTEVVGLTDVQREENPDDQKFNILIKVVCT